MVQLKSQWTCHDPAPPTRDGLELCMSHAGKSHEISALRGSDRAQGIYDSSTLLAGLVTH